LAILLYLYPSSDIQNVESTKTGEFVGLYSSSTLTSAYFAQMAKLVDAPPSGGGAARCAGSSPVLGTNNKKQGGVIQKDITLPSW
jgi:hypothetical protein